MNCNKLPNCVLSQHLLGRTEENHTNRHLGGPITQPRFKTSISKTQVYSITVNTNSFSKIRWLGGGNSDLKFHLQMQPLHTLTLCICIKTVCVFSTIWHSEDRASWYILIMKANKMHYFSDLFDKVLYMFWTCPLSIIRSISTLYIRNRYLSC